MCFFRRFGPLRRAGVSLFFCAGLLMAAGCVHSGSGPSGAGPVEAALQAWIAAVNSRRPEAVEALYQADAVLLPTLSSRIRTDAAGRLDYFRKFTALPGLTGVITETHLRRLGDAAIAQGLYTFTYREGGREVRLPARFSFTFVRQDGAWKITDHHSSPLPE